MLEKTVRAGAHAAWLASCWGPYRALRRAHKNPAAVQEALLEGLLRANASCAYGRKYGFGRLRGARDFQNSVPIVDYDDLKSWIDRILAGEQRVLTNEPVLIFEKTSGSTTAAKYIPYTLSLRREFQRAVGAWMFDLYANNPQLAGGSAYWAITPIARETEITPGGLRVGFENDTEYLDAASRFLLHKILAVPEEVARIPDLETAIYVTLRFLLQSPSLAFISVWAPSFLIILHEHLQSHAESLLADLREGTLRPPKRLPCSIESILRRHLRADRGRAQRLERAWREYGCLRAQDVWPNLRVISCWTDASSRLAVPALRELFPGVVIQGKGLLATEGIVSLPLVKHGANVAAATSHFYEFIQQPGAAPQLLHELEANHEYSVQLTTGGGLYRYQLGDRVRVTGFAGQIPLLEFIGKEDGTSDLCGEKLNPAFVGSILAELLEERAFVSDFVMLAPSRRAGLRYVLFLQGEIVRPNLAGVLDDRLARNPHYAYCRRLGQLAAPQIFQIAGGAAECYLQRCVAQGQRAGAVKTVALHRLAGWEECFAPNWVECKAEQENVA
ncbi:MAG: GH3 auxin-responsive promoter family protein [Candidatus Acidiferrales bacterium]